MLKNKKKNRVYFGVITFILILILIVMFLSLILNKLNISGQQTSINNGLLESSLVTLNNVFSIDGIKFLLGSCITNLSLFEPLIVLMLSVMCVGILESSGILNHVFSRFMRIKTNFIIFITLLISIVFSCFGEYSYLLLFPLIGTIYKVMGKNPIIGIITVFLGITLGYGMGTFINSDGYMLGLLTEQAAVLDVDPSYKFNIFSTIYIMIVGAILILFMLTLFIERNVIPKVKKIEKENVEYKTSKKGLVVSGIMFIVSLIIIVLIVLPKSPYLDQTGNDYMSKLFGEDSIIKSGILFIILMSSVAIGTVYGKVSNNFKNGVDSNMGISYNFNNLGYTFVIMFFGSMLISILDYTNIGTIIVTGLTNLLSIMDFSGIFLIVTFIIIVIIMTVLVPGMIDKWVLMSPIIVPLFMRANITPEFCQYLYVTSSSIGRAVTPLFLYILIMVGFVNKYDSEKEYSTVGKMYKLVLPTTLSAAGIMILFVLLWYVSGLPVGVGGYPSL